MRKWLSAGLLLLGFAANAQNNSLSISGCGTVTTPEEMQRVAENLNRSPKLKTTTGLDSIPLSIHIVGDNNGAGYYRRDYLFTVLCQLNTHYAPIGFYFYIKGPITYINNSNYYVHDFWNGQAMMNQYNIGGTVNVYFVSDPAGNCGYFAPSADGLAIAKSCANPNSTTLVHELGHYFGLPHTFSGWENGATPSNPEKVTRGAGANCSTTGDLFCDTDADYLGNRWNCPYTGNKLDVTGTAYHPDSSLYMCYSDDACMTRFSAQQKNQMINVLHNNRSYLLTGNPTGLSTLSPTSLVYPGGTLFSNKKIIRWNKVQGADFYYVKIGIQIGSLIKQDTVTADTVMAVTFPMVDGGLYRVTVYPMSSINVCMSQFTKEDFMYSNATTTSVDDVNGYAGTVSVFPNPADNAATVKITAASAGTYNVVLTSINGQKAYEQNLTVRSADEQLSIPTASLPSGMYMVKVTGNSGNWTEKLMIQH